jgi:transcriptional regulator with XRE-family HTH domain
MAKIVFGSKTKKALKGVFAPLKASIKLTPGKAIRIYREAQGYSQAQLAARAGLRQTTISGLEHDRITLGIDRAKAIARALGVHPAVLAFPSWDIEQESAA